MKNKPYFPVFLDLAKKRALVVGAGNVGTRRAMALLDFCAEVRVVAKTASEPIQDAAAKGLLRWEEASFQEQDLDDVGLVVAATDDENLNSRIAGMCRGRGILTSIASDRNQCNFYFPALVRWEDFVIGISSGGAAPEKTKALKERIQGLLTSDGTASGGKENP